MGFCSAYPQKLKDFSTKSDFELAFAPVSISSAEDAQQCVSFLKSEAVDLIILQCCALAGDGNIVIPFAKSGIDLVIWCVPEPKREGFIPLNSMTCTNLYFSVVHSLLKDLDVKVKWLYGDTDDPLFYERLNVTLAAIRAKKHLSCSKVARIGGTAEGFINLSYDAALYEKRLGVKIVDYELDEILEKMKNYPENEVKALLTDLEKPDRAPEVGDVQMENSARLILALRNFAEKEKFDALAVSCWPEFQIKIGLSTCMAFGQLNDAGLICSCEGDVPGAISMILLDDLSNKHPMIMDMVALDEKEDAITFWHCGMGMPSYADQGGYCFIKYPAYPEILDEPGVSVDLKFAPQAATVCRLNGMDAGTLLAASANIVKGPDRSYAGARGWFTNFSMRGKKISAVEFFDAAMRWGIAHHYVISSGHVEAQLLEFAGRLGIEVVKAEPYADYI